MHEAISNLNGDHKQTIILHLFEGMSFGEMEKVCQTPKQTLYTRYHRAIQKLKSVFKDQFKTGNQEM